MLYNLGRVRKDVTSDSDARAAKALLKNATVGKSLVEQQENSARKMVRNMRN